jgi:hypothetical protein
MTPHAAPTASNARLALVLVFTFVSYLASRSCLSFGKILIDSRSYPHPSKELVSVNFVLNGLRTSENTPSETV